MIAAYLAVVFGAIVAAAAFALFALAVARPASAATCADLAKLSLPHTTITTAESVTSGAFTPSPDEHVLKHFRRRLDDFLSILEQHLQKNAFAIGDRPTVADISMMAYLSFPRHEAGYEFDLAAYYGQGAAK